MSAISFTATRDEITPSLARLSDPALMGKATMAAGLAFASLAQRSFDEANLRPAPWAPRKKAGAGNPLLIKSGTLRQSIHVQLEGDDKVRAGTPVPYGATHQLGSAKKSGRGSGNPPRPYFPVTSDGRLTPAAEDAIGEAVQIVIDGAV
jgi:phage gpG-like protein